MKLGKSFLAVLVFWHPYCSSINSTHFNFEHENTFSFPCHIGSSILLFRDMYLHVIVRKEIFVIIFCIKSTIYKKKIQKNSYKNLFFILLFYYTLTEKLYGNALSKKEKLKFFSHQKFLLIKQFSMSTHSTKLMILLLLNILQQYSIHFI